MIELDDITVSLPPGRPDARTILKNISLVINDGEWVALVGPNGSGKSTLLRAIAGVCPVSAGRLRVGPGTAKSGSAVSDARGARPGAGTTGVRDAERASIALLLQEPDNQFVASTVQNELLLSVDPSLGGAERDERIARAVERFSFQSLLDRNPHRLSGGEKQRLALATVWLFDPEILLLDEPASYLDAEEREKCVSFVRDLNRNGVTVVWATPGGDDLREARRVVYLDGGEVRFDGPSDGFDGVARERGFDVLLAEYDAPISAPSRRPVPGESVISMRSISFAYDDVEVFREASGDIRANEAVGIAGRVGSGKSTLLSLIGGVLEPTGGSIQRAFKRPVEKKNGRREQTVFYLFQSPERLFFAETVFEEVAFGLKSLGVARGDLEGRVQEALSRVALDPGLFLDRLPFSLSLGEMRRLAFAIAYALRPKLLLLDEPTSCLDAAGRKILREMIDALRSEGTTVVTASHDRLLLRRLKDRCWTIVDGRFVDS